MFVRYAVMDTVSFARFLLSAGRLRYELMVQEVTLGIVNDKTISHLFSDVRSGALVYIVDLRRGGPRPHHPIRVHLPRRRGRA